MDFRELLSAPLGQVTSIRFSLRTAATSVLATHHPAEDLAGAHADRPNDMPVPTPKIGESLVLTSAFVSWCVPPAGRR